MSINQQKCHFCEEMHDVVMTSPRSKYIKICLECYVELDTKGQKDYGFPKINRNTGNHDPRK